MFLYSANAEDASNWHVPEKAKARLGKGNINEIQYTPDGKTLAVATDIGIWLYDTHSYKEIALLGAHTERIECIDFNADGSLLAAGSGSNVVLWDMSDHTQRSVIEVFRDWVVLCVAFSPDGKRIAAGMDLHVAFILDVETGVKIAEYSNDSREITGVEFSPDGQSLLIEGTHRTRSKSILQMHTDTDEEIARITVNDDGVNGVAFSPDGKLIASASERKDYLLLWDVENPSVSKKYIKLSFGVSWSVTFSPDSSMIAVGGLGKVTLYDTTSGKQIGFHTPNTTQVISVAFSPDGKTFASATDHQIYLWNIDSAQPLITLNTVGENTLKSVAISPDGRTISSGGSDESVTLWDADTGILKERFSLDTGVVNSVAFSPNGNTLAVGTDGVIDILNIRTTHKESIPIAHFGRVLSLNFSPDGNTIACAGDNSLVVLIDAVTLEQKAELRGHKGQVNRVVFNPSGTLLASGDDKQVILWDTDTYAKVYSSTILDSKVWSLAFSPDGNTLAIGGWFYNIVLMDINTYKHRTISDSVKGIADIAYSMDGENIITASMAGLHLWDVEKGRTVAAFIGHKGFVTSAGFNPTNRTLVSSGVDGTVRVWNETGGGFNDKAIGFIENVSSVDFSPDGTTFATTGGKYAVRLWDAETFELKSVIGRSFAPQTIAFNPNGTQIATGGLSDNVELWDVKTGQQIAVLEGHTGAIETIDYSPDGKTIASGGRDGLVILWDSVSGIEEDRSNAHQVGHHANFMEHVRSVIYNSDGQTLASGRDDAILLWEVATDEYIQIKTPDDLHCLTLHPYGSILASGHTPDVYLWHVNSGEQIAKLEGHVHSVQCVVFSPDGRILASGGSRIDNKIILWDVELTKEIVTFTGHTGGVRCAAFSPDGNILVSGGQDGTALIWDVTQYK